MDAVIDSAGRVVIPKVLRDALGLAPGTRVDISRHGAGVQVTPTERTATLQRGPHERLVATGTTPIDDDVMFAAIDAGRS